MDVEWLNLGRVFVKLSEILEGTNWHFFSCPFRSETHQSVFYFFTVNIIMVPAMQYLLLFICVRTLNICISKGNSRRM